MMWTDDELVAKSISGDADSFNELVLRWERPIYALAYRTIGREEDARDVCQETFLRALTTPRLDVDRPLWPWLATVAHRMCSTRLEERARRSTVSLDDAEPALSPARDDPAEYPRPARRWFSRIADPGCSRGSVALR